MHPYSSPSSFQRKTEVLILQRFVHAIAYEFGGGHHEGRHHEYIIVTAD